MIKLLIQLMIFSIKYKGNFFYEKKKNILWKREKVMSANKMLVIV